MSSINNMEHKKIVFYIDTMYRGGAQRVMSVLVNGFCEKGYDVTLINDFVEQNQAATYDINSKVKRLYLTEANSGNAVKKNIIRIKELRVLIKKEKPDVILSFLGRPNQRMLLAAKGLKVKKYVSVRNDPNKEYGINKYKKKWVNHLFEHADGIVFQTEDAGMYFSEKVRRKSQIICNPVSAKFFRTERQDIQKNVIAVGRLEKQKNHRLLIEAFAEIAKDYANENLIIYGEGPLRNEIETLVQKLKLSDRIELPGNIDNIEKVLAGAKLFVMTSDYEGLPNALMEAMTVGVPCISTNCPCGGPNELIESNVSGILVPCGDKTLLIEQIRRMLDDNISRKAMGVEARKKANEFRTELVLDKWEQFLMK